MVPLSLTPAESLDQLSLLKHNSLPTLVHWADALESLFCVFSLRQSWWAPITSHLSSASFLAPTPFSQLIFTPVIHQFYDGILSSHTLRSFRVLCAHLSHASCSLTHALLFFVWPTPLVLLGPPHVCLYLSSWVWIRRASYPMMPSAAWTSFTMPFPFVLRSPLWIISSVNIEYTHKWYF